VDARAPKSIPDWPALHGPALVQGTSLRFMRGTSQFQFKAPAALLRQLVGSCDGRQTREEILRQLSGEWQVDDVKALLEALTEAGLIVEAGDQCAALWEQVTNPQCSVEPTRAEAEALARAAQERLAPRPTLTYRPAPDFALRKLLERRRSARAFSGLPVPENEVLALLWALYGVAGNGEAGLKRRTVPSGGRLYPLEVVYCNLRPSGTLAPGIYAAEYTADGCVGLTLRSEEVERLAVAMFEPELLRNAQGMIVVGGRFSWSARKYSNRALSIVTLEAGHAAQNALLAAAELDLASIELGGFVGDTLARACGWSSEVTPLTTILFGQQASAEQAQAMLRARAAAPQFAWADLQSEALAPSEHVALARFDSSVMKTTTVEWCWGRDAEPLRAHDKAVAEAWERRAYREFGRLSPVSAPLAALEDAVQPETMVRYADWQYALPGFRWRRFEPDLPRDWTACESVAGKPSWVPLELVLHVAALSKAQKEIALSSAGSSGMAAYPTLEGALERGLLELIERDAFMVTWLTRRATPALTSASLPSEIGRRVKALEQAGFRVVLKDLSLDTVPVVLGFSQHAELSQTLITAAAGFHAEEALEHAVSELEAHCAALLTRTSVPAIEPAAVATPSDHAKLYAQRKYFRRADWLAGEATSVALADVGACAPKSFNALAQALRERGYPVLWRDMTIPGASLQQGRVPLHIARVLVPGLVPISFGFGTEMLGLPRLSRFGGVRVPHGPRPLFPHPFP
jgi:ribosomal protein S12 methylthiotransferase accessory factor